MSSIGSAALFLLLFLIFNDITQAKLIPKHCRQLFAGASICLAFADPFPFQLVSNANEIGILDTTTILSASSSKENIVIDRSFDELPSGAKKRRAVALCKEDSLRRAAGYASTSDCTSSVLSGDFKIVTARSQGAPSSTSLREEYTPTSRGTVNEVKKPSEKVLDLSDLTIAQKKRRALAACKRAEIRAYIKSSESKCSIDVNRGDYGNVIEALEYGI